MRTVAALPGSARPAAAVPAATRRRHRRDRHGRGRRGILAPAEVPLARSRAQQFDDLVLDAVEELEERWANELARLQFGVEEVPPDAAPDWEYSPDVVVDHGVLLAELRRELAEPVVVIYRRPVEARAGDTEDRADLVFSLVVEMVAEWLGKDVEDIDPR